MSTLALFGPDSDTLAVRNEPLADGACVLRHRALADATPLLAAVADVIAAAPLRRMVTPGGRPMSVAMTSCGDLGWITDRRGYRYAAHDPDSGRRWPPMPSVLSEFARRVADEAGHARFAPDACLVNRYEPGARMALHQDRDERDDTQPIVSVSFGLPAMFLFGGLARTDPVQRVPLVHGDVVVWGGPSRLRFHGVMPLRDGWHASLGAQRLNLTFRKAG